ncbi:hypothetical protein OPIT5_17095 [Opitutaceae bacterium TAV5]|nr:hypothetical protein OPIT5_17095 [Opitutaceae bacterium TAV5]
MKKHTVTRLLPGVLFLGAALLASACNRNSDPAPPPTAPSDKPTLSEKTRDVVDATKETAQDAWSATKDKSKELYNDAKDALKGGINDLDAATWDERAALKAKLDKVADEADTTIAGLKSKASDGTSAVGEGLDKAADNFRASVADLGDASAETWDAAKAKVRQSWDDLQKAFRDARTADDDAPPAPVTPGGGDGMM